MAIKIDGGVWGHLGIDDLPRLDADVQRIMSYLRVARYGVIDQPERSRLLHHFNLDRWLGPGSPGPAAEITALDRYISDVGQILQQLMMQLSRLPSDNASRANLIGRVLGDDHPGKLELQVAVIAANQNLFEGPPEEQSDWARKKRALMDKYQEQYPNDPLFDEP